MKKRTLLLLTALLCGVWGYSQSLQQAAAAMQNGGTSVAKKPQQKASSQTSQGMKFVDLGLSVKWANCNLGASSPSERGNYYAWGETATKSAYIESNSRWTGISLSSLQYRGVVDSRGNLTADYDAATKTLGAGKRIPTKYEFEELINKCKWAQITVNGVKCLKATGPNGNSIVLPITGWRDGSITCDVGSVACYWSSTVEKIVVEGAYMIVLQSNSNRPSVVSLFRFNGYNIRPVAEK